ncbi:Threonine-tRNA ligase [Heracleum sosnowskyi]|uniref:Threonine-tRNA ligase n=1 Tax=Heracleum sosnowskyi TaxID=360622 RepID=A0AAD8IJA3_9APIA|nr:Threonine-tRNA ligase [Heracleum sosnowskyi]
MASSSSSNDLQQVLAPLYQRASEAEDRLARLEAALATKQDSGYQDLLKKFDELKLNLEDARTLQDSEREKVLKEVQQLASENAKLQYRIIHLVRALEEANSKTTSN